MEVMLRYSERNSVRAALVERAQDWQSRTLTYSKGATFLTSRLCSSAALGGSW
jgi:hypothetical protein